jgi:cytochrome c-type biogenesis protein CcmE
MGRRKKYVVGGTLVAVALVALLFNMFQSFSVYYYTVSEVTAKGDALYGQNIRVAGKVGADPIGWDARTMTTTFTLTDEKEGLPVVYKGVVPDTFKEGAEVVVEGKYGSDGTFQGDSLIAKCPSKYEPQPR